jgi:hypothetical protein
MANSKDTYSQENDDDKKALEIWKSLGGNSNTYPKQENSAEYTGEGTIANVNKDENPPIPYRLRESTPNDNQQQILDSEVTSANNQSVDTAYGNPKISRRKDFVDELIKGPMYDETDIGRQTKLSTAPKTKTNQLPETFLSKTPRYEDTKISQAPPDSDNVGKPLAKQTDLNRNAGTEPGNSTDPGLEWGFGGTLGPLSANYIWGHTKTDVSLNANFGVGGGVKVCFRNPYEDDLKQSYGKEVPKMPWWLNVGINKYLGLSTNNERMCVNAGLGQSFLRNSVSIPLTSF